MWNRYLVRCYAPVWRDVWGSDPCTTGGGPHSDISSELSVNLILKALPPMLDKNCWIMLPFCATFQTPVLSQDAILSCCQCQWHTKARSLISSRRICCLIQKPMYWIASFLAGLLATESPVSWSRTADATWHDGIVSWTVEKLVSESQD